MKNLLRTLVLVLLIHPMTAQEMPASGRTYQRISIDLTGDGKPESVVLVAYDVDDEVGSYLGRLKVLDTAGKPIWSAPTARSENDPFAFGAWPYGVSEIEWLGDIDGDGKIELLSPAPVSDIRPPTYHVYRWQGTKFVAVGSKMLLLDDKSSAFKWTPAFEWDGEQPLTWVSKVEGKPGAIVVDVTSYDKAGNVSGGRAKVKATGTGLQVQGWEKPLR